MDSRSGETRKNSEIEESNSAKPSSSHTAIPNRIKLLKFGSASLKFKQYARDRDEISRTVPSSRHGFPQCVNGVFSQRINWFSVMEMIKEWMKDPTNLALFVWFLCVAVSGAILFLVMTRMLNFVLPKKSQRNAWVEVNNQILNGLFTLMCLYQHPKRFYHLVLLCRWKPEDILKLRKIYCRNGTYKPHEWIHMMVVVLLLHLNCFAQYAFCGLNLGYKRSQRPVIGVVICISLAIAALVIAGVYTISSSLGRDYEFETDKEAQVHTTPVENKRDAGIETRHEWSEEIFDLDVSSAFISLFCTCCVFGRNMERLGFGNMYVHIATFLLLCTAPFWIIYLASVNIDNETIREVLGLIGIILCVFGLLYGGFWRIQMRERFNLPSYTFCFGEPSASDCMLWLCCCWCALAQEVQTGNSGELPLHHRTVTDHEVLPLHPRTVMDHIVRPKHFDPLDDDFGFVSRRRCHDIICPSLYRQAIGTSPSHDKVSSELHSPNVKLSIINRELTSGGKDETMTPPSPSVIERRDA